MDTQWLTQDTKIVACGKLQGDILVVTKPLTENFTVGQEVNVREPGRGHCSFPTGTRIKFTTENQVQ